jgi:hypothetical protein
MVILALKGEVSMKLGTVVRLPDGRVGTCVYNSLIGVGIKWGIHNPDPKDFEGTSGDLFSSNKPDDWPWKPDALLRDPWPTCEDYGFTPAECVGGKYTVIEREEVA